MTFQSDEYASHWGGCSVWSVWLLANTHIPLIISGAYVVIIFVLQNIVMKNRPPMDLKGPLALWNLLLATFSIVGAYYTVPVLVDLIKTGGYTKTICAVTETTWCDSRAGFWVFLFILSKSPELVDTLFLALRKKEIMLLHWYHHATVLLFCWYAGAYRINTGLWFAAMNLCVHSIMYTYYFFCSYWH